MKPTARLLEQLGAAKEVKKIADRRAELQLIETATANKIRAQIERAANIAVQRARDHSVFTRDVAYTTPWIPLEDYVDEGYQVQGRLHGIYNKPSGIRSLLAWSGVTWEPSAKDLICVQLHIRPTSYDGTVVPDDYDFPVIFSAHTNQIFMDPTGHDIGMTQDCDPVVPESAEWYEISSVLDRFTQF